MNHRDIEALMTGMAPVVRDVVANAFKQLNDRLEILEKREPVKGEPGRDGKDGLDGAPGRDGEQGAQGEPGKDGVPGPQGEPGKEGPRGWPGKDGAPGVDGKDGAPGLDGKDGAPGRDGKDGAPGKDGAHGLDGRAFCVEDCLEVIADAVRKEVGALPKQPKSWMIDDSGDLVAILDGGERSRIGAVRGKDGARGASVMDGSVDESGVLQLRMSDGRHIQAGVVRGRDGLRGEAIQGRAGRDAVEIQIVRGLDESRSYSAGTCAYFRGGVIRAERDTSPIENGDVISAGWSVMLQGIAEEYEETVDDGRTIVRTTVYTSGAESTRTIKTACIIDRGVWKSAAYERGDGVTYAGSFFIAQREAVPEEKPGQSDAWRLAVKRGRDGADGKLKDTTPKPVKV